MPESVSSGLVRMLDQAYNRKSWHGTNLRGAIRGLSAREAAWRPAAGRHSIHELVLHTAYWKYAVLNRLVGGARGSFPRKGSNWFVRPAESQAWADDVALLDRMHRDLRACAVALAPAVLDRPLPRSTMTPFALLSGVAAHDLYHAGQIQLIKTVCRRR